ASRWWTQQTFSRGCLTSAGRSAVVPHQPAPIMAQETLELISSIHILFQDPLMIEDSAGGSVPVGYDPP
ncbi:MAG: hypothetical protein MK179_17140, partial [Pirellulaceae bacterium]|nr:hypothetical protein [Pirellulaceae bacterium]